jgi:hypothetical protein
MAKQSKVIFQWDNKIINKPKVKLLDNLSAHDAKLVQWLERPKKPEELPPRREGLKAILQKLSTNEQNSYEHSLYLINKKLSKANKYKLINDNWLVSRQQLNIDGHILPWYWSLLLPLYIKNKIVFILEKHYIPLSRWHHLNDSLKDNDHSRDYRLDVTYYKFLVRIKQVEKLWFWAERFFLFLENLEKRKERRRLGIKNTLYKGLFTRRKLEHKRFKFKKNEEALEIQEIILWIRKNSKLLSHFLSWQKFYLAKLIHLFDKTTSSLVNNPLIESLAAEYIRLRKHIINLRKNFKTRKVAEFRAIDYACRLSAYYRLQPIIEDLLTHKYRENSIFVKSKWNTLQYLGTLQREWTQAAFYFENMLQARHKYFADLAEMLLYLLTYKKPNNNALVKQTLNSFYYERWLTIFVNKLQQLKSLLLFSNDDMRLIIAKRGCNKIIELAAKNIMLFYAKRKKEGHRKPEYFHAASFADIALKNLKAEVEETVFLLLRDSLDMYKYKLYAFLKNQEIEIVLYDLLKLYVQWEFVEEEISVLESLVWRNKIIVELILPDEIDVFAIPENIEFTDFFSVELYKKAFPLKKFPIQIYYKDQLTLLRHLPALSKWIQEDSWPIFLQLWNSSLDLLIILYYMKADRRLKKDSISPPRIETPW